MEQDSEHQTALSARSLARVDAYTSRYGRTLQLDTERNPRARASLILGEHGRPDRLLIADRHLEHEEHLVAHELGHAELVLSAPADSRQTMTLKMDAVNETLGPHLVRARPAPPPWERPRLVRSAAHTVGARALSYPEDVVIERQLAADPGLVALQRQSLASQADRLGRSLQSLQPSGEPEPVKRAVTALDGGYILWLADFLRAPAVAASVSALPHSGDATYFSSHLRAVTGNDIADCRGATDAIMDRLGLRSWYRWRTLDL